MVNYLPHRSKIHYTVNDIFHSKPPVFDICAIYSISCSINIFAMLSRVFTCNREIAYRSLVNETREFVLLSAHRGNLRELTGNLDTVGTNHTATSTTTGINKLKSYAN